MSNPNNLVLVYDVETGGDSTNYIFLCLGACIGNIDTGAIVSSFSCYVKSPPDKPWEERCLTEFWDNPERGKAAKEKIMDRIAKDGMSEKDAADRFVNWIRNENADVLSQLSIWSDTTGFDEEHLNAFLHRSGYQSIRFLVNGSYMPTRDASSFHAGIARKYPQDGMWGAEEAALKTLGVADPRKVLDSNPYPNDHDPENDAKHIFWEMHIIKWHCNLK